MRSFRQVYYDAFSRIYDRFVALHSSDAQGDLRKFLADNIQMREDGTVLDICTGTASLLVPLRRRLGPAGKVIGVDFSRGMLQAGREKTRFFANIQLIQSNVGFLPFRDNVFDSVTCSYAFYELKGETQDRVLTEVKRVLKPDGAFLMMEHNVPKDAFIRALFYIRLASMGAKRAISILRHEKELLKRYFHQVEKVVSPNGRTKIMICRH